MNIPAEVIAWIRQLDPEVHHLAKGYPPNSAVRLANGTRGVVMGYRQFKNQIAPALVIGVGLGEEIEVSHRQVVKVVFADLTPELVGMILMDTKES